MNCTQKGKMTCPDIQKATAELAHFVYRSLDLKLEPVRLSRASYALVTAGCSTRAFPGESVANHLIEIQRNDGGWSDVEETLWCLGYLAAFNNKYNSQMAHGRRWLESVQLPCKGWGRSGRDQPRIPLTALATILVPEIIDSAALGWLAQQWEEDLANPTQLTYKGAFFLLSQIHSKSPHSSNLVNRTISYLENEQEEDGGFGPWKRHPMGSDPWTTGIVLWGLSKVRGFASKKTIERALSWLESEQLPNGLWPYHYLDDGTSMALIGISSVLPMLRKQ